MRSRLLDGLMSDLRHRWGLWLWSKPNTQKNGRGICLNSFLFSTDVIQNMNSSIVSRDCKKFQTTTNNCPQQKLKQKSSMDVSLFMNLSANICISNSGKRCIAMNSVFFLRNCLGVLSERYAERVHWMFLCLKKNEKQKHPHQHSRWNGDVTQNW